MGYRVSSTYLIRQDGVTGSMLTSSKVVETSFSISAARAAISSSTAGSASLNERFLSTDLVAKRREIQTLFQRLQRVPLL